MSVCEQSLIVKATHLQALYDWRLRDCLTPSLAQNDIIYSLTRSSHWTVLH